MTAPTLGDVQTPADLANWFAAGDTTGHIDQAIDLCRQVHGPDADNIWLHGSQMADQLGVW